MSLDFSLIFLWFLCTFFCTFGESTTFLPNLELKDTFTYENAGISTGNYLKSPCYFRSKSLDWNNTKKVHISSSTDQLSVRPDQGAVHDHTTPSKWSISGTKLYKVSGTLYNDFSSSCWQQEICIPAVPLTGLPHNFIRHKTIVIISWIRKE